MTMKSLLVLFAASILILPSPGCRSTPHAGQEYLSETLSYRSMADSFFRFDPQSPFRRDSTIQYHGLNWYPPDSEFTFQSKLYRYSSPSPVTIYGTKGEERKMIRYGYFLIDYRGRQYVLNICKRAPKDTQQSFRNDEPLSVWFTDETTGHETYGVGRYIDIGEEKPDPNFLYTINFNNAYNPYCAYSSLYSCAIPMKEDHLPFAVHAGEKKYHP